MEPYKVVLWGNGPAYDLYYKYFQLELMKGNMKIAAIVLNEEGLVSQLDGVPVIRIEEILNISFDYLINMNLNPQDAEAVDNILAMLKVEREKVISAQLFIHPFFDLKRYVSVRKSNISIVAINCWGGYTYHSLGLRFTSPFINMAVNPKDFLKIQNNLAYYMQIEPHMIREEYEPTLQRNYPVMGLEDVELNLIHYTDFEEAVTIWKRRRKRINYDNLLTVMMIETERELQEFLELPSPYKLGFSTVPSEAKEIIYFPSIRENGYLNDRYEGNFWDFINHMAMNDTDELRQYDILKLLNHEEDYRRSIKRF